MGSLSSLSTDCSLAAGVVGVGEEIQEDESL